MPLPEARLPPVCAEQAPAEALQQLFLSAQEPMALQSSSSGWWACDEWCAGDADGWGEGWAEGWAQGGQGWEAWGGWDAWEEPDELGALAGVITDAQQTMEAGERLLQRGRVQGALRSFDRAMLLVEPYLQQLREPGAGTAARRLRAVVVSMLPKVASCHLRGERPELEPNPAKALAFCEEALRLEPRCGEAGFQKSEALRALGRQEEADAALAQAAEMDPCFRVKEPASDAGGLPPRRVFADAQQLCEQGGVHFKRGDLETARSTYDEGLALLWRHQKHWEGKAGEGGIAQQLNALAVSLLTNIAQCQLQVAPPESEKAFAYCEEALRLDPANVKALFRKGKALVNLKAYADAHAAFARAAELDPKDRGIRKEMDRAWQMDDYLVRLWAHQQSCQQSCQAEDPSSGEASPRDPPQAGRGEASLCMRGLNHGGIRRVLKRGARAAARKWPPREDSDDSELPCLSASAVEGLPDLSTDATPPEEAAAAASEGGGLSLESLQGEVQQLREQGTAHFKRGEVWLAAQRYERCIELLGPHEMRWRGILKENEVAKQLCATALAVLTNLAQCHLQGDPPELPVEPARALECCQEALELDPKSTKALFRKGKALSALGRHSEAEMALARAAKLEPKLAEIRSELEKVQQFTKPKSWPDAALPTPLGTIGAAAIADLADDLTADLVEQGVAGYSKRMLFTIWLEVERHFGMGAGKQLARIVPLVGRMARGDVKQQCEPGKGRRSVFSYIEGLLPEAPWHAATDHPWCTTLAAGTSAILNELRAQEECAEHIGANLWEAPDEGTSPGGGELNVYLVQWGVWVAGDRFPKTRGLLSSLKGMRPFEVMFVKMPPRSKCPLHLSDSNCVLSAHLGLELDEGSSNTLRVGETTHEWRMGQVFVFDHTYEHVARNKSARWRVTLVCRFYHPGVSEVERYTLVFLAQLMDTLRYNPKWRLASLLATGSSGLGTRFSRGTASGVDEQLMLMG